jgi:hypothetical protein
MSSICDRQAKIDGEEDQGDRSAEASPGRHSSEESARNHLVPTVGVSAVAVGWHGVAHPTFSPCRRNRKLYPAKSFKKTVTSW